jgi:hypothetical protein
MTFDDITQQFEHSPNGSGTDAFLAVKDATRELMGSDPGNAAIYFLIYNVARSYVFLLDDVPISTESANESKQQLLGYMKRLSAALGQGEAALLATASAVINEYMASKRPF